MPGHAVMVQGELGLPACEVVTTGGVCVAGMTALKYAFLSVASGQHRAAVATGSELSSASMRADAFTSELEAQVEILEPHPELAFDKDFLRWMLSDGAGAVSLEARASRGRRLAAHRLARHRLVRRRARDVHVRGRGQARRRPTQGLAAVQRRRTAGLRSVMSVKQDVKLLHDKVVRYTVEKPIADIAARAAAPCATRSTISCPHYSSLFFREKLDAGMRAAGLAIPQARWFTHDRNDAATSDRRRSTSRSTPCSGRLARGRAPPAVLRPRKRQVLQRISPPDGGLARERGRGPARPHPDLRRPPQAVLRGGSRAAPTSRFRPPAGRPRRSRPRRLSTRSSDRSATRGSGRSPGRRRRSSTTCAAAAWISRCSRPRPAFLGGASAVISGRRFMRGSAIACSPATARRWASRSAS